MGESLRYTVPNPQERPLSAYMLSAALNEQADLALFVDAEHALDLNHAQDSRGGC